MEPSPEREEVLDTRARGRWLSVVLTLLVAAALVRVAVTRSGDGQHPSAPAPAPSTVVPLGDAAVVTSVDLVTETVGDTVYAVDGGIVVIVDLDTGRRFVLHAGPGDAMDGTYRLVADPGSQRLWVIRSHDGEIDVSWFDTATFAQTGGTVEPGVLTAAALLDGRLYLGTTRGVVTISVSDYVPKPRLPIRPVDAMTADPARHRLLVTRLGRPFGVAAQVPGARAPQARSVAPFDEGQLTVAGGRIWAVGVRAGHAVLAQLDARTLRVRLRSPLEPMLGRGAVLVQTGDRHLLVRSPADGYLWCVDAETGAPTHVWRGVLGTPVLAERGVYELLAGEPLHRLGSAGCTG